MHLSKAFKMIWGYPALGAVVILLMAHTFPAPFIDGGLHQLGWLAGGVIIVMGRVALWLALSSDYSGHEKAYLLQGTMNLITMGEGVVALWLIYRFVLIAVG